MKKTAIFFACIIGSLLVLAGCKNGPAKDAVLDEEIFGTWNQITEDGSASLEDLGIPSGYIFNEDGTGTDLFWDLTFKYQTDQGVLYLDYDDVSCDDSDYTYAVDGNVITMTRNAKDAITMMYRKEVPETEPESEQETEPAPEPEAEPEQP